MCKKIKVKSIRKKLLSEICVEIDTLLKEQNLSEEQFCRLININPKIFNRWKQNVGYVDLYFLCKICACFDKKIVIKFEQNN